MATIDLAAILALPPTHPLAPIGATARRLVSARIQGATSFADAARALGITYRSLCRIRAAGLLAAQPLHRQDRAVMGDKSAKRRDKAE